MFVRSVLVVVTLLVSACGSGTSLDVLDDTTADVASSTLEPKGQISTESGLIYEVLTAATGPKPTADSVVTLDYSGTLVDGTVFDSSYERGTASTFNLANTIEGFKEGVQLMSVGSRYRFTIPSDLGYGDSGTGSLIGPGDTLIFEVELHEINS